MPATPVPRAPAPPAPPAPPVSLPPGAQAPHAGRSAADGKLVVTCTCGLELQARRQFAGTQVRCPSCGTFILLPGRTAFGQPQETPAGGQQPHKQPLVPPGQVTTGGPSKPAGLLGHELIRYVIIVVLLILTLVVSFAGLFLDGSARKPDDKGKPEPAPKQAPAPPK